MPEDVRRGELRGELKAAVAARDAAAAVACVRELVGGVDAKAGDVFVCASALGKLGPELRAVPGMRGLRTFCGAVGDGGADAAANCGRGCAGGAGV